MSNLMKYSIFTDASFDDKRKIATYSIVVKSNNKILKSFSKKCKVKIMNSTESEIFGTYQAINLILSCYYNKNKKQKFCLYTDCKQVLTFFSKKGCKNTFTDSDELKEQIIDTYKTACLKLTQKNYAFSLNWISREQNVKAHKEAYNAFIKVKKTYRPYAELDNLLINKNAFLEIISRFSKSQNTIIKYLINKSDMGGLVNTTQSDISNKLDISMSTTNRTFTKLEEMGFLEKIKNGKYILLT